MCFCKHVMNPQQVIASILSDHCHPDLASTITTTAAAAAVVTTLTCATRKKPTLWVIVQGSAVPKNLSQPASKVQQDKPQSETRRPLNEAKMKGQGGSSSLIPPPFRVSLDAFLSKSNVVLILTFVSLFVKKKTRQRCSFWCEKKKKRTNWEL